MAEYDRGTINPDEHELKRVQLLLLESMAPADDSSTRPAQTEAYREVPGERLSEVIREIYGETRLDRYFAIKVAEKDALADF